MKRERLCEVTSELRPAVLELGTRGDAEPLRMWAQLQCPSRGGHCDKAGPCRGFTPANRQAISELQDRLFQAGFVRVEEQNDEREKRLHTLQAGRSRRIE